MMNRHFAIAALSAFSIVAYQPDARSQLSINSAPILISRAAGS